MSLTYELTPEEQQIADWADSRGLRFIKEIVYDPEGIEEPWLALSLCIEEVIDGRLYAKCMTPLTAGKVILLSVPFWEHFEQLLRADFERFKCQPENGIALKEKP